MVDEKKVKRIMEMLVEELQKEYSFKYPGVTGDSYGSLDIDFYNSVVDGHGWDCSIGSGLKDYRWEIRFPLDMEVK